MSTAADYADREADMLAFRGVFPQLRGREQLLAQELVQPGDGGALIAGIEKLAQIWLIVFLTKKGSKFHDKNYGTLFMTQAERGQWRTVADVEQSFYTALVDSKRQIQAVEQSTDPDDERYSDVSLDGVTLTADKVSIRVTVTSLAGSSYTFMTPIQVAIR